MMMTGIGKSHQIGNLMISYDQLEEVQRLIKQAQELKSDVFALNGTIRLSDKDGTIVGYLTYDAETQTWGLAPPVVTPPSPNLTYPPGVRGGEYGGQSVTQQPGVYLNNDADGQMPKRVTRVGQSQVGQAGS